MNRSIANWLLNECRDYLSESFKDVTFPIKVHTNVVDIAKTLVVEKLSKLTDKEFAEKMKTMKDFGAYKGYLKAKTLAQLIEIAKTELDVWKLSKTYKGTPIKNEIMIFNTEEDFEITLSKIFAGISHQIEEDLGIDLDDTKLSKLSGLSRESPSASEIYEIIASNPKVYGTMSK